MSIQSMVWAMKQQIVTDASARHILLCLSNYSGEDGRAAFPSVQTLSIDTGLSERTIRAKLDFLESIGVIKKGNQAIAAAYIDRADRRPVCYDIMINVMDNGVQSVHERGANNATGCNPCSDGVQSVHERGAATAPNTSFNPSSNPSLTSSCPAQVPNATKAKKWGTEDDHKAARYIFAAVRTVDQTAKDPNWAAWANEVRLMREQDKRTHREICELFEWANLDQFWRANVLSPGKLREKWTQLQAKRNSPQQALAPRVNRQEEIERKNREVAESFIKRMEEGRGLYD